MAKKKLIDRIEINPKVMVGKPVIRGTRVTVELILEHLAAGWTMEEVLRNHPRVTRDDVLAALAYARSVVGSDIITPRIRNAG